MRKLYSLVLMAAALLIGTNAWAGITRTANSDATLQAAWAAAQNGDVIQLTNDITLTKTLWLGTNKMKEASKSLTLDLNGHLLTASADTKDGQLKKLFFISHGELIVKSSVAGGRITHTGAAANEGTSAYEIFRLTGSTYENVNPKTAESGYYTHLVIEDNVQLTALANAIVIDRVDGFSATNSPVATAGISTAAINYNTNVYRDDRGVANGVRVDVYGKVHANKYGIKANGNMGSPATSATAGKAANYWANPEETIAYAIDSADIDYAPFIHIHSSAEIKTLKPSSTAAIATYSGGYSRWKIEGYCEGSTGVYVKSGEVSMEDAVIKSNYTGTYEPAKTDRGSGVDAGGSGIVVESATAYAGNIDVKVEGDTKVAGTTGYAIDEAVTAVAGVTKVDGITITGGTFETGAGGTAGQGTIKISEPTADANANAGAKTEITIAGGQVAGTVELGNPEEHHNLDEVVKPAEGETKVHVTYVDNGNGGVTMVISQGEAPAPVTTWSAIVAMTPGSNVDWGTAESVDINKHDTVVLGELLMNAGNEDAQHNVHLQQITIKDSALLQVDRLVMNSYARIIVEAGGKIIANGEQGIVAPVAENILMKNEDGKRSIFLFNPAATSNRHPHATVELITNSWRNNSSELQWEVVGFPTFGAVTNLSVEGSTQVALAMLNSNGQFVTEGLIGQIDNSKLNKAFAPYDLLANRAKTAAAPKIIIEGELVGNVDADMNAYLTWTPLANSYTGELDLKAFLTALAGAQYVSQGVYVPFQSGQGSLTWQGYLMQDILDNDAEITKLAPMQAFMLHNPGQFVEVRALNYSDMVWAPATAPKQNAPRRSAASETTAKVRVVVANEQGAVDKLMLRENANNVYALEKYMNEDMNIYVLAEEKNCNVIAEDLENTYVGFSTVNGGNFTLSFANVAGREYTLVDHETGARVAMVEGNTYEFTAAANSANDYRFEIVDAAKMPTAIENTEAVKSAKGIYTITGQYLGEMNVWNTLPAGVYVINGEKRVK